MATLPLLSRGPPKGGGSKKAASPLPSRGLQSTEESRSISFPPDTAGVMWPFYFLPIQQKLCSHFFFPNTAVSAPPPP